MRLSFDLEATLSCAVCLYCDTSYDSQNEWTIFSWKNSSLPSTWQTESDDDDDAIRTVTSFCLRKQSADSVVLRRLWAEISIVKLTDMLDGKIDHVLQQIVNNPVLIGIHLSLGDGELEALQVCCILTEKKRKKIVFREVFHLRSETCCAAIQFRDWIICLISRASWSLPKPDKVFH